MENGQQNQNANPPGDAKAEEQKFTFTAEIQKLLQILVHSLYTQKEIFLRELVSNAGDALDKVRVNLLTDKNLRGGESLPLEISISADKEKGILIVKDTGIGMTKEELVENLGTIAHSGSLSFLQSLSQEHAHDVNLIGQFGVGFYSVFMVAKKVEVLTLSAKPDSTACLWSSEGMGEYTITEIAKEDRGTEIRIHLKEDAREFLETYRIKDIVQKYSDFVSYPIRLENEQINRLSAIWRKSLKETKDEEYEEFFKYIAHTTEKPASHIHLAFDAPLQFYALLFIPSSVPFDMKFQMPEKWRGIHLYARRVFIQSDCEELLPVYLRFVRGVVDSDDLPLNISRETLQENQVIRKIRENLVRQILETLDSMSKEKPEDYKSFWHEFGKFVKQGYRMDYANRERLAALFRFNSSRCEKPEDLISLEDYVSRMPEGQKEIYYISGENRAAVEKSPHLEMFKGKGVEVLYLTDPVDDFLFQDLREFKGKTFASVDQEEISLDAVAASKKEGEPEAEKPADTEAKAEEKHEANDGEMEKLLGFFHETLKGRVASVRLSKRLLDSPCCLVSSKEGPGVGLQKLFKMMDENYEMPMRILEINPKNPLIANMAKIHARLPQEDALSLCCHQLLDNVLLLEGTPLDTRGLVPRIQKMMGQLTNLLSQTKDAEKC